MEKFVAGGRPTIEGWFRELMRGPVRPYGDYFERLGTRIESSAPVLCEGCV